MNGITFESAAKKYLELRTEVEAIEAEAKKKTAAIKKIMADVEGWITLKAQDEGLETVKTHYGTAYWSTHNSASVANPEAFKQHVITTEDWGLMETRASKVAVAGYIKAHGEPPPGINFSSIKVFNLRQNKES